MRTNAVTIRDVAKRCGVSPMTVSFALNDKPGEVSAPVRDRVRAAARELGYRPNVLARALVTGRSHAVTLWMKTLFPPYSAQVIHHVRRQAEQGGVVTHIWDMGAASSFPQWPSDGVLALEGRDLVDGYFAACPASPLPLVSLGGDCSRQRDFVALDLRTGAMEALRHLVEIGCQRIAYLLPARGDRAGEGRYGAYTEVVHDAGLTPERIVTPDSLRAEAVASVTAHVKAHGPPDGLFCYNDDMAIGANRALRELGLAVPGDVALVGCDGIEETEYQHPALSTISLPLEEMCRLGWQFLQNRLQNPDLPWQQIVLPTHLIVRDSSRRRESILTGTPD